MRPILGIFIIFISELYTLVNLIKVIPNSDTGQRLKFFNSTALFGGGGGNQRQTREIQEASRHEKSNGENEFFSRSTFQGVLPFTEQGFCEGGTIYRIKNGEELRLLKYLPELECIFHAGLTPNKVPEGPMYGTIVSILNTRGFNHIVNLIWWGKVASPYPCRNPGDIIYIGWNNLLSHLLVPFVASIGPIRENLAPGEFNDGQDSLIIDYSKDFTSICGHPVQFSGNGVGGPWVQENIFPLNQIVDALRFVGRQEDGGAIYLGKTYLRDSFRWVNTVLYFYFVNYDTEANGDFEAGDNLPPLKQSFQFSIPGMSQLVI